MTDVMSARYYRILEEGQRWQVPLSAAAFERISAACQLHEGMRVLDLGCGSGELLCRWARQYALKGTGVDWRASYIAAAQARAAELEVWPQVHFVESEPASFTQDFHEFDCVVSLVGSWPAGGLAALLDSMRRALRTEKGGYLVLGETYWRRRPSAGECAALRLGTDALHELPALVEALQRQSGGDLVAVWLAETSDWDQYYAAQWRRAAQWLADHPDEHDASGLRAWLRQQQRQYFEYERDLLGWGAFVLRVTPLQKARMDENGDNPVDWF